MFIPLLSTNTYLNLPYLFIFCLFVFSVISYCQRFDEFKYVFIRSSVKDYSRFHTFWKTGNWKQNDSVKQRLDQIPSIGILSAHLRFQ